MAAIEAIDIHKRYGPLVVLQGLTLRVERGEVYGLLGPNGAGKSTLIHLLLGFLRADRGQLAVLGTSPAAARSRLGYLPERLNYYAYCTAREYLHDMGGFSGLRGPALADRCRALLEQVGLAAAADRRIGRFSKGMLQRLGIAQALIHDPELLLIDEPTSGLDPAGQHELIELLSALRRKGHTILLCSHQLAEVEALCDRVGIMHNGRLAAAARITDLAIDGAVTITSRAAVLPGALVAELCAIGPAVTIDGREIHIGGDDALQQRVLRALLDAGVAIGELRPFGGGLVELYLKVTHGQPLPARFAPQIEVSATSSNEHEKV
jgi:ABC-2 type transport system ATP-binding protein